MADLQAEIPAVAEEMVASGAETGLQVAVHQRGQVVGLAAVTRIDRIIAEEEEHR